MEPTLEELRAELLEQLRSTHEEIAWLRAEKRALTRPPPKRGLFAWLFRR